MSNWKEIDHVFGSHIFKVCPDPSKVESVNNWPQPSCQRDIKQFLGLANYYRRYIQNFASIADPKLLITEKLAFHLDGH